MMYICIKLIYYIFKKDFKSTTIIIVKNSLISNNKIIYIYNNVSTKNKKINQLS